MQNRTESEQCLTFFHSDEVKGQISELEMRLQMQTQSFIQQ